MSGMLRKYIARIESPPPPTMGVTRVDNQRLRFDFPKIKAFSSPQDKFETLMNSCVQYRLLEGNFVRNSDHDIEHAFRGEVRGRLIKYLEYECLPKKSDKTKNKEMINWYCFGHFFNYNLAQEGALLVYKHLDNHGMKDNLFLILKAIYEKHRS